ncbi:MAG: glycerol-3-phosphate 1-O-acyltransferase PlsY [Clostridiales bacterium]|nr:glycerol-3-phosphate 1-O-acyltransferase PlsY [Clostridiales bacterium]
MFSFFEALSTEFKLWWIPVILLAYALGNISPSILIARAAGIDIRKEGSGNAGTTNVLRVMGNKAAAATLVIDVLKGVVAVLIGKLAGGMVLGALCALAVFCGHIWPAAFGFKGGKGIATGLGILLTLDWRIGLCCLGVAVLCFVTVQRVSVGSLLATLALPFLAWYFCPQILPIMILMAVIVWVKHRANIKRILKGEEPKFSFKKK